MKRFPILIGLIFGACAGPQRPVSTKLPPPPPPAAVVDVQGANFEALIRESVPNVDEEGISMTIVFIDGKEAGKTAVGPRSQDKRVRLKLPAGNLPIRLEQWYLPPIGEWTRLPNERQPRERFVRVEEGAMVRLTLKYGAEGMPTLLLSRGSALPR